MEHTVHRVLPEFLDLLVLLEQAVLLEPLDLLVRPVLQDRQVLREHPDLLVLQVNQVTTDPILEDGAIKLEEAFLVIQGYLQQTVILFRVLQ